MNAWLIYSEYESKRNKQYIDFYMEEGKKLDINIKLLIVEGIDFGIKDSKGFLTYYGEKLLLPEFAICRMIYPLLTMQLELMGIQVFNNSFVSMICNDKAKTYQYVTKGNIPIVDTIFCKKEFVAGKLEYILYPSVVKTTDGHGGTEVFLIENKQDTIEVAKSCQGKDIVIQPFVGKTHQDLRVYVIGKEIIAAVLRTAKDGFKSNFCLGGEVKLYELSSKERENIYKVINLFNSYEGYVPSYSLELSYSLDPSGQYSQRQKLTEPDKNGFGLVGIDFIIGDHGELLFNEIEDVVGSRMLYQCSDINIVKLYLEYIIQCMNKKNRI